MGRITLQVILCKYINEAVQWAKENGQGELMTMQGGSGILKVMGTRTSNSFKNLGEIFEEPLKIFDAIAVWASALTS